MIFTVPAGVCCGLLAALAFSVLPSKWLCDYGAQPEASHSRAQRRPRLARCVLFAVLCVLCVYLYARNATVLHSLAFAGVCGSLLLLALCDAKYGILPDEIMLLCALLAMPIAISDGLVQSLVGAALGFCASLAVLWLAGKLYHAEAVGMGDVKLMALSGFVCGVKGLAAAVAVSVFSAAIIFGILILIKRLNKRDEVAFGPYLVFGVLFALCLKPEWNLAWNSYLSLLHI